MNLVKKLLPAPLFLVLLGLTLYLVAPLFKSSDFIFSLDLKVLIQLVILSLAILFTGVTFIVLAALSQDWKVVLPVMAPACLLPFIFFPPQMATVLGIGLFVIFLIAFVNLEAVLKSYFNFQPATLFFQPIRQTATLLIVILCLGFYLSANNQIQKNGFSLPDSVIDAALKLSPSVETNQNFQGVQFKTVQIAQLPTLTPQQLEMLRKNPELLRQYGVDPRVLDTLPTPAPATATPPQTTITTSELIKPVLKDQINKLIKPYLPMIPIILTVMLFLTLQTFASLLSLVISPSLWLIFYILEKTKFITFATETREVKKLVV